MAYQFASGFVGTLPLLEAPGSTDLKVAACLHQFLGLLIGTVVTFLVEWICRQFALTDPVMLGVADRFSTVALALRACVRGQPLSKTEAAKLSQYAVIGAGRLRDIVIHMGISGQTRVKISAVVNLASRLINITAHDIVSPGIAATP